MPRARFYVPRHDFMCLEHHFMCLEHDIMCLRAILCAYARFDVPTARFDVPRHFLCLQENSNFAKKCIIFPPKQMLPSIDIQQQSSQIVCNSCQPPHFPPNKRIKLVPSGVLLAGITVYTSKCSPKLQNCSAQTKMLPSTYL